MNEKLIVHIALPGDISPELHRAWSGSGGRIFSPSTEEESYLKTLQKMMSWEDHYYDECEDAVRQDLSSCRLEGEQATLISLEGVGAHNTIIPHHYYLCHVDQAARRLSRLLPQATILITPQHPQRLFHRVWLNLNGAPFTNPSLSFKGWVDYAIEYMEAYSQELLHMGNHLHLWEAFDAHFDRVLCSPCEMIEELKILPLGSRSLAMKELTATHPPRELYSKKQRAYMQDFLTPFTLELEKRSGVDLKAWGYQQF